MKSQNHAHPDLLLAQDDVSAGEEQQLMLFNKAFDTHPQYPVIITEGIGARLMDEKVGGKLSGIPGVVISRIKST